MSFSPAVPFYPAEALSASVRSQRLDILVLSSEIEHLMRAAGGDGEKSHVPLPAAWFLMPWTC